MSVRFRSRRREAVAEIRAGAARNVRAAATFYLTELRRTLLKGLRTGKQYRVPGGVRRMYTASAPGQPPAPRTGRLANSFTDAPVTPTRILVGSPLRYARYLEIGTRHMAPRPHFKATFTANRRRLQSILSRRASR